MVWSWSSGFDSKIGANINLKVDCSDFAPVRPCSGQGQFTLPLMCIISVQFTQIHNQISCAWYPGTLLHHFPVERSSEVTLWRHRVDCSGVPNPDRGSLPYLTTYDLHRHWVWLFSTSQCLLPRFSARVNVGYTGWLKKMSPLAFKSNNSRPMPRTTLPDTAFEREDNFLSYECIHTPVPFQIASSQGANQKSSGFWATVPKCSSIYRKMITPMGFPMAHWIKNKHQTGRIRHTYLNSAIKPT